MLRKCHYVCSYGWNNFYHRAKIIYGYQEENCSKIKEIYKIVIYETQLCTYMYKQIIL